MATNRARGHENLGFLSVEHGFVPSRPPLLSLPPTHRAWDDVAANLPELFRTLSVRPALEALPVLSAVEASLPPAYLCRASALLSIFAHAYHRVRPTPPASLPPAIQQPWAEVTRRLGRPQPFLSYIDLIVYNWRLRDAARVDPMRVENLDLLIPTVGTPEERIFYLTQVEILAQSAPLVGATMRAQEAVLAHDVAGLQRELLAILERLQHVTEVSLQKIDPNPYSPTYVDPVVWAKMVASFATPTHDGRPGPSGTTAPVFHLLDTALGRRSYATFLGQEAQHIRDWYPAHWRAFLGGLAQVSVREFVEGSDDRSLQGLFHTVVEGYTGDKGFLGVHRRKVYGYLETAFKLGRSSTIGGFRGLFKDREWNRVDAELDHSRNERQLATETQSVVARPKGGRTLAESGERWVKQIVLDVAATGLRYRAGDRCGVLPENSDAFVARMLRVLRASGDEPIRLDRAWQQAMHRRSGPAATGVLPLAILLRYGTLRPVLPEVAKALSALSASSWLRAIVNARAEDQWELWELLAMLQEGGFETTRLWQAEPWEAESICTIVPPAPYRLYSISSTMDDAEAEGARELQLTVARLVYDTPEGPTTRAGRRYGTASSFLGRTVCDPAHADERLALTVVPALRFHLPADPSTPLVLFAGGTGIAPFLGFLRERAQQAGAGETWLFFGTRTREDLFYREELEDFTASGHLQLRVALSREDTAVHVTRTDTGGRFVFEPGRRGYLPGLMQQEAQTLWNLLRDDTADGRGASVYVCGRTGFAVSVANAVKAILAQFADGPDATARATQARQRFYCLAADGRYREDIFTTYAGPFAAEANLYDASDVVLHNNAENGYWFVVGGKVYDVGEFRFLHPGGDAIITAYAGLDATDAYRRVQHHLNPEVDALLTMYQIGAIRRLDFRAGWMIAVGPQGLTYCALEDAFRLWARYLYLVVEMENALTADFSILRKRTTEGEDPADLTPCKAQLAADVHARFVSLYLDGLTGDDLDRLWAITTGLCAPEKHVLAMQQQIAALNSAPDAALARHWAERMTTMIERWPKAGMAEQGAASGERMRALCALLEEQDRRFLSAMKMALRAGVKVFEEHEANAAVGGRERLMESIERVPAVLGTYYAALAQGLRAIVAEQIELGERAATEAGVAQRECRWAGLCWLVSASVQRSNHTRLTDTLTSQHRELSAYSAYFKAARPTNGSGKRSQITPRGRGRPCRWVGQCAHARYCVVYITTIGGLPEVDIAYGGTTDGGGSQDSYLNAT